MVPRITIILFFTRCCILSISIILSTIDSYNLGYKSLLAKLLIDMNKISQFQEVIRSKREIWKLVLDEYQTDNIINENLLPEWKRIKIPLVANLYDSEEESISCVIIPDIIIL